MKRGLDIKRNRKDFFSSLSKITMGFFANQVENLTTRLSSKLLRPPGALDEFAFLTTCTRCDRCIEACPEDALVKAEAGHGLAMGTPYLIPRHTPCFLCTELPCVTACPEGALVWPRRSTPQGFDRVGPEAVWIGTAIINTNHCLTYDHTERAASSCQVCLDRCPYPNLALSMSSDGAMPHPTIHEDYCTGCGLCVFGCPTEPSAIEIQPKKSLVVL